MDILNYTTYDEIRATCGLASKELPDTELAMEIYKNVLSLALSGVDVPTAAPGPGPLSSRFITIKAISIGSRTTDEQKLYDLTRVFSTYTIALEVVVSLSMKAVKSISDSKASLIRFSPESVYRDVISRIEKVLKDSKDKIENIVETAVDDIPLSRVVEPAIDVVTGV